MSDALLSALEGKKDEDSVWIENLLSSDTVYRSDKTKDKYEMAPNGQVGSVVAIPVKVAKESYLRRAVSRGKIHMLTESEATEREGELVFVDDAEAASSRTLQALEKGASDVGSRYTKQGLSDDGTEQGTMTARQIWGSPAERATTVRRSDVPTLPITEDYIEPIIDAPVKEGDPNFRTQTGLPGE